MSFLWMNEIYESNLPRVEKSVAVALAHFADSEGGRIFPSITTISKRTCYGRTAVAKAIRCLRARGVIERVGWRGQVPIYRIVPAALHGLTVSPGDRVAREMPTLQRVADRVGVRRQTVWQQERHPAFRGWLIGQLRRDHPCQWHVGMDYPDDRYWLGESPATVRENPLRGRRKVTYR